MLQRLDRWQRTRRGPAFVVAVARKCTIGGSGIALLIGVAVSLWAGLGVTIALGHAFDVVWSIAPVDQ